MTIDARVPAAQEDALGCVLSRGLWAGIFFRSKGEERTPAEWPETELRKALTRNSEIGIETVRRGRIVLLMANPVPLTRDDRPVGSIGPVSVIAGEPFIDSLGSVPLNEDLRWLHEHWSKGEFPATAQSRGTFCGVHISADGGAVTLVSDRLGIRPIYFAASDDYVVFATAQRVLADCKALPKVLDIRGVMEMSLFGHCLSDRTVFANIKLMHPAEFITLHGSQITRKRYWRLDQVQFRRDNIDELTRDLYRRFREAILLRLRGDKEVLSFLSGGLDSRSIVTELHSHGVELNTLSFGGNGTQDQYCANLYAISEMVKLCAAHN